MKRGIFMNKLTIKILSCILVLSLLLSSMTSCRWILDYLIVQDNNVSDNNEDNGNNNTVGGNNDKNDNGNGDKNENDDTNDGTPHVCEWMHIEDALSPTCSTDGIATYLCSCGKIKTEIIAAIGHNFSDWETVSEASCESAGSERRICTTCELENTRYINKLKHDYTVTEVEVNYVKTKTYSCSLCNDTFVIDSILSESFEGIGAQSLSDCPKDFTFYIISSKDESYIRNNLTIFDEYYEGTEHESSDGVVCDYDLTVIDTNIWLVTPKKAYTPGNTYKATKSGDIIFKDYGLYDFTFSIFKEETQIMEVNNDIIFLQNLENQNPGYYPYSIMFSENSNTYWLTLGKIDGLNIGDVICVGDAENADVLFNNYTGNNTFGKIVTANYVQNAGYYLLSLSVPSINEIFDKLEIYSSRMNQINETHIDEVAFAESVTEALLSDEDFITFAGASFVTAKEYAKEKQYASTSITFDEFLESIKIEQNPEIGYNEATQEIFGNLTILGEFSFPITLSSSEVGSIVISFQAKVNIDRFKIVTGYNSEEELKNSEKEEIGKLRIGVEQTLTIGFEFGIEISLDYSLESQQYLLNTDSGVYHYVNCKHVKSIKETNVSKISTKSFVEGVIDGKIVAKKECGSCQPVTALTTHSFIINDKVVHLPSCPHVDLSKENFRITTLEYGNLGISGYNGCKTCHPEQRISTSGNSFSNKLLDKMESQDFGASLEEIKAVAEKVKLDNDKGRIPLCPPLVFVLGPFSINCNVYAYVDFELKASINYKYEVTISTEYGLKKQGSSMVPYNKSDDNVTHNILTAVGSTRLDVGLIPEVTASLIGLEKALYVGLEAKIGIYAKINGALQFDFLDDDNSYMAAYFESGIHYGISAFARIPIIMSNRKNIPILNGDIAILTLGYAKLCYNYADAPAQIVLTGISNTLNRDDILTVKCYDLDNMKDSTMRLEHLGVKGKYSISYSLTNGSKCKIENGYIIVTDTSKDFSDTLTIRVTGYDDWGKVNNKNICFTLPEIKVEIVFNKVDYSIGLEYMLSNDGKSYLVTGIGSCKDTDIIIPSKYEGKTVTGIGRYAFHFCQDINSVIIPGSVTRIGDNAFSYCTSLTNVIINNGVKIIGIGAFQYNPSLESIFIPSSVTRLDGFEFNYCANLTSISVDENNKQYKSIDGNLYTKDGKTLLRYAIGKKDAQFTIPDGVTTIDASTFCSCANLTTITIPKSVTTIGLGAFALCDNLRTVYYLGTEAQWNNISIDGENDILTSAKRYYGYPI